MTHTLRITMKTPERALWSSLCFLAVQGRWEWIFWLSEYLTWLYFFFVTNLQKKIMAYICLQLNIPLRHSSQYSFSWTSPPLPLSVCALWMTPYSFLINFSSRSYLCIWNSMNIAIVFIAKINLHMGCNQNLYSC